MFKFINQDMKKEILKILNIDQDSIHSTFKDSIHSTLDVDDVIRSLKEIATDRIHKNQDIDLGLNSNTIQIPVHYNDTPKIPRTHSPSHFEKNKLNNSESPDPIISTYESEKSNLTSQESEKSNLSSQESEKSLDHPTVIGSKHHLTESPTKDQDISNGDNDLDYISVTSKSSKKVKLNPTSSTPVTSWQRSAMLIHGKIVDHRAGNTFLKSFANKEPNYTDIVTFPLALDGVRQRIRSKVMNSLQWIELLHLFLPV